MPFKSASCLGNGVIPDDTHDGSVIGTASRAILLQISHIRNDHKIRVRTL